jgi:hypothetical protein
MILRYQHLHQNQSVFKAMTGLHQAEFDELVRDVLPGYAEAEEKRLSRPNRTRAIGGGPDFELEAQDQILLTVVWLRKYPTYEVLGYLFGTSDTTVGRTISRILPLLEAAGRDTMRMPDPGRKRRQHLDELLKETPELAVIIDTFEQAVQRPQKRAEADPYYSGKKKCHTLKSQVAVDEQSSQIVEVAASTYGPTADLTLLKHSGLLERLPPGVGAIADLAYVGIEALHPTGLGATPRRKPRGQPRPAEDMAFNTAFSRRRIKVEHTLGRVRRYEALSQTDRHHRTRHTERVVAVAGLVNWQIRHRLPGLVC